MIVFISGASAGFGQAIARRFVAAGHKVILAGRRLDRLQTLRRELGDEATAVALDVRDRAAVKQVLSRLPDDFSAIDVLVNNAGLALGLDRADQADLDQWEQMVDTNCKGLMFLTRAVLPGMIARGRGHVINIGSTAGEWPYPGSNVYGASKAFVRQFSLNLRADLYQTPIRVTDLEPGLSDGTEFSQVRFNGDAAKAAQVYAGAKPLQPEDIAEAAFWSANQPAHVNVNTLSLTPVCQGFGPVAVHREPAS